MFDTLQKCLLFVAAIYLLGPAALAGWHFALKGFANAKPSNFRTTATQLAAMVAGVGTFYLFQTDTHPALSFSALAVYAVLSWHLWRAMYAAAWRWSKAVDAAKDKKNGK